MRKIGFFTLLLVLAGCTTTGSMPILGSTDSSVSPISVNNSNRIHPDDENITALKMSDIHAINASIAASEQRDWAPQEEVLQQEMSEDF